MSKLKNYVKKHKASTVFLSLILLLVLVWSGGRIYKTYHPNHAYYDTDFMYNGEAYEHMGILDDGNWRLLQDPTVKLGKGYNTPHSLIPNSTLFGFEDDTERIFVQSDNPLLPLVTYMKKKDYRVFDVNCIEKILIEHIDVSTQKKLVGYVELTKQEDFSFWISLIQELRSGNHEKSDHSGFRTNEYRVYFYIKGIPNARYWVANINLEERTITVGLTAMDPPYVLSEQLAEMIIKEEKAVK